MNAPSANALYIAPPRVQLEAVGEVPGQPQRERKQRRIVRGPAGRKPACDAAGSLRFHPAVDLDMAAANAVCLEAADRAGLERLLRYSARPAFDDDHPSHSPALDAHRAVDSGHGSENGV